MNLTEQNNDFGDQGAASPSLNSNFNAPNPSLNQEMAPKPNLNSYEDKFNPLNQPDPTANTVVPPSTSPSTVISGNSLLDLHQSMDSMEKIDNQTFGAPQPVTPPTPQTSPSQEPLTPTNDINVPTPSSLDNMLGQTSNPANFNQNSFNTMQNQDFVNTPMSATPPKMKKKLPIALIGVVVFAILLGGIYFLAAPAVKAKNYVNKINPIIQKINTKNEEMQTVFEEYEKQGSLSHENLLSGNYEVKELVGFYEEMESKSIEFQNHFKDAKKQLKGIKAPNKDFEALHSNLTEYTDLGLELSEELTDLSKYFKQIFSISEFESLKNLLGDESAITTEEGVAKLLEANNKFVAEFEKITPPKKVEKVHELMKDIFGFLSMIAENLKEIQVAATANDINKILEIEARVDKEMAELEKKIDVNNIEDLIDEKKYKKMDELVNTINKQIEDLAKQNNIKTIGA